MAEHGKAVRIEIEWEDGVVQTLRGEQAEKYMELEKSLSFNAWNHGWRIEPLPWEYTQPTKDLPKEEKKPGRVKARYICSVCKEPQRWTPSGPVCKNGHGGAPTEEAKDADGK